MGMGDVEKGIGDVEKNGDVTIMTWNFMSNSATNKALLTARIKSKHL